MSGDKTLKQIIELIEADPHGAAALTLYALVNTLEFPRAGYLFKLDKLKDLAPQHRQLAYGLMEMMAEGQVGSAEWQQAKASMDDRVRRG